LNAGDRYGLGAVLTCLTPRGSYLRSRFDPVS